MAPPPGPPSKKISEPSPVSVFGASGLCVGPTIAIVSGFAHRHNQFTGIATTPPAAAAGHDDATQLLLQPPPPHIQQLQ
ncbi:hypothetical protein L1987_57841 [Smallanthus sonchifolius]|uniref:Uncharacterized protein n=1 Tax=Smallanthus sonchifolius TaxID=185202 RepID=A0ACB9DDZ2_9ASTR|nr:hypothetical protein L1987_57841 [Smallanthus sonchifolius]